MAFSQLLAADGLRRNRGIPVGCSMPTFMAEYFLIERHV
jgi:hypothetical protein